MNSKKLLTPLAALCVALTVNVADAQVRFGSLHAHHAQIWKDATRGFATSPLQANRPPLTLTSQAAHKPTVTQARLSALYLERYDGSKWEKIADSMKFYWSGNNGLGLNYLELMGMTNELYAKQQPISYEWSEIQKYNTIYTFDSVHQFSVGANGDYSEWSGRWFADYNNAGKITELLQQEFNPGTSTWEDYSKMVFSYQNDTLISSILVQEWDGSAWENEDRISIDYNNAQPTLILMEEWDGSSSGWDNTDRYSFHYSGNDITRYEVEEWAGGWEPQYRNSFKYNNGNRVEDLNELFYSSNWDSSYRISYVFDASGNMISALQQEWNSGWSDGYRYTFTYNAAGAITSWLAERWDGANWNSESKTEYEYIAAGSGETHRVTELFWDGTSWMNKFRWIVDYNSYGMPTQAYGEAFDDGSSSWFPSNGEVKFVMLYEEFDDGTQPEPEPETVAGSVKESVLSIYPNPASERLYITGDLNGTVRILDIAGRELRAVTVATAQTIEVPVDDLAPGTYIVQIGQADGSVQVAKVSIDR